jgi:hypothetical protein
MADIEKQAKHTPGPWKVISEAAAREVEVFEIAEVSHFRVICEGRGDGFSSAGNAYCDARLISAAPTMLEALLECVEPLEPGEDCPLPPAIYNKVCAAIAKATGSAQ